MSEDKRVFDVVCLNVGGFPYTIERTTLLRFTDSFFDKILNSQWKEASDSVIEIQRDGELFRLVLDYMYYGMLPRNQQGITFLEADQLMALKGEAEFFNLRGLVDECDALLTTNEVEHQVKQYAAVHQEIEEAKSWSTLKNTVVVYKKKDEKPGSLLALLRSNAVIAPAWVIGKLCTSECNPTIFKSTTLQNVNVDELIAHAKQSPFGRGNETVFDTNVRDSVEIKASELCDLTEIISHIDISSLAPSMKLTLKPYKLVIYQQDGHFDKHRDTVRDEHHIGTLVLILNTEYTGGELEISHLDQSVLVTGALKWAAMYGDCIHTIHPVTSGSRVSLIFDIWNESPTVNEDNNRPSTKICKADEKLDKTDLDSLGEKCTEENNDFDDSNVKDDGICSNEENDNDGANDDDDDDNYYDDYEEDSFWPDSSLNTSYWLSKGTSQKPQDCCSTPNIAIGGDVWIRIYKALDKELEKFETVSICTEHLYPPCQANLFFLKGGDRVLYEMLKERYCTGVTPVVIGTRYNYDDGKDVFFKEFAPEPSRSRHIDVLAKNKLLIPKALGSNSVLHHIYGAEHTANEPQDAEFAYLAAALVVKKRK